jgi:hypothetical protein
VILQVLPIRDIGGVAAELRRDLAQRAQRRRRQGTPVAAHPHHEVLGLEQFGVLITSPRAVVTLLTLGVEAHPAHPTAQVVLVDGVKPLDRVGVRDSCPHIQGIVVLLELFVGVERLAMAERPLPFVARLSGLGHGAPSGRNRRDGGSMTNRQHVVRLPRCPHR